MFSWVLEHFFDCLWCLNNPWGYSTGILTVLIETKKCLIDLKWWHKLLELCFSNKWVVMCQWTHASCLQLCPDLIFKSSEVHFHRGKSHIFPLLVFLLVVNLPWSMDCDPRVATLDPGLLAQHHPWAFVYISLWPGACSLSRNHTKRSDDSQHLCESTRVFNI